MVGFGPLPVKEAARLKAPEEENYQLKRLVADQVLDRTPLTPCYGHRI